MSHGKISLNPADQLTRPKKRVKLPAVPKWSTVEALIKRYQSRRERAALALMAYGGLRREEVVSLDMGDFAPEFGLRRVIGKGGHESSVPLPEVARKIVEDYLTQERCGARRDEPIFTVQYFARGRRLEQRRMLADRLYKLLKALGNADNTGRGCRLPGQA